MIKSNTQPQQVLVIDDNEKFVKSIAAHCKFPVNWLFENYSVLTMSLVEARKLIDSYTDFDDFLILININIKIEYENRTSHRGVDLYRHLLSKLKSGGSESILLYSFLDKDTLASSNIFLKILPDEKFKRLPFSFNELINT